MKIEVLRLIEDSLIGGKSGEMAFIENNPFIAGVFREYSYKTKKDFKSFLLDCINDEEINKNETLNYKYEEIKKSYSLDKCSVEYKEYRKLEDEIRILQNKQREKLREMAERLNPQLVDISTYEIKYREFGQDLEFKIDVRLIK